MNDPIVAPDGAEGPPLFLLACAAMEGAGDEAVGLAKQLLESRRGPQLARNRPQHGKNLPTLCLVIGALEAISDPPDEKAATAESAAARRRVVVVVFSIRRVAAERRRRSRAVRTLRRVLRGIVRGGVPRASRRHVAGGARVDA